MEVELGSLSILAFSLSNILLTKMLVQSVQEKGDVEVSECFAVVATSFVAHSFEASAHDGETFDHTENDQHNNEEIVHENILKFFDFAIGGIPKFIPVAGIFNDAFTIVNTGDDGKILEAEKSNLAQIVDEAEVERLCPIVGDKSRINLFEAGNIEGDAFFSSVVDVTAESIDFLII